MNRAVIGLAAALQTASMVGLSEEGERTRLRAIRVARSGLEAFDADKRFHEDMLEGFARLHHLQVEWIEVHSYGLAVPALIAGRGEVVAAGLTNTEARRRVAAFSVETFPTRMVVVTRSPHPPVRSVAELRSATLGTESGSSWSEAIRQAGVPANRVTSSYLLRDLPAALKRREIEAAVFEVHVAVPAQVVDPHLELGMFLGPPVSLGFAVRRDDSELLRALNQYVMATRRSGDWNRLVIQFFGGRAPAIFQRVRAE